MFVGIERYNNRKTIIVMHNFLRKTTLNAMDIANSLTLQILIVKLQKTQKSKIIYLLQNN